jgi:hypothetical protein
MFQIVSDPAPDIQDIGCDALKIKNNDINGVFQGPLTGDPWDPGR